MSDTEADQSRWLRTFRPSSGNAMRLFCFPYAGGAASYYFPLSEALAPRIEVQAVQYPGRQDRRMEPCLESVGELAECIVAALSYGTDRPYAFFGHSMGAIVAFEVARRLQHDGRAEPCWLFVSGRRAPSRCRAEAVYLHLRNDRGIVAELRALGGTDPRWLDDEELLASILPQIRSDYRAIETYSYLPGPPLDCPVTAFAGDSDPYASVSEVAAWHEHSTAPFDLRVFSGGHFFLDMHRREVTDIVSSTLERVSACAFPERR
jgi:pyochelin biosynthesis protein PchC